jgi:DNA replication and repair protein RecF
MRIVSLSLRNFRCFSSLNLDFEGSFTLIIGSNGIGKTSLLEALHYFCYLRSFKTHVIKELIHVNAHEAALAIGLAPSDTFPALDMLQANLTGKKRAIKLNEKAVGSYKELYAVYKVITITEDDLMVIQGAPSVRRSFIDQMLILKDPAYALLLRKYRQIVNNRNALLNNKVDRESYYLWTDQLFSHSMVIQQKRREFLDILALEASSLVVTQLGSEYTITSSYQYVGPYMYLDNFISFHDILNHYPALMSHEYGARRSLFGAHLDDYALIFHQKDARIYASRGQQKLIIFLLKLAQLAYMSHIGQSVILLVDDFITDFDSATAHALVPLMTRLASQVIITSSLYHATLKQSLSAVYPQLISL